MNEMIVNNFFTFLALYHRISLNHFVLISFSDYSMEILHNLTFQGWKKMIEILTEAKSVMEIVTISSG